MFNPVTPGTGRPIFLHSHADFTSTQLAVDRVTAADGEYDVMFIGTGERSSCSLYVLMSVMSHGPFGFDTVLSFC